MRSPCGLGGAARVRLVGGCRTSTDTSPPSSIHPGLSSDEDIAGDAGRASTTGDPLLASAQSSSRSRRLRHRNPGERRVRRRGRVGSSARGGLVGAGQRQAPGVRESSCSSAPLPGEGCDKAQRVEPLVRPGTTSWERSPGTTTLHPHASSPAQCPQVATAAGGTCGTDLAHTRRGWLRSAHPDHESERGAGGGVDRQHALLQQLLFRFPVRRMTASARIPRRGEQSGDPSALRR